MESQQAIPTATSNMRFFPEEYLARSIEFFSNPISIPQAQSSVAFSAQTRDPSLSSNQGKAGPCDWCRAPSHDSDRCWSKDPKNLKKYPSPYWTSEIPPPIISRKYCKMMTKEEATRECSVTNRIRKGNPQQSPAIPSNPCPHTPISSPPAPKPHLLPPLSPNPISSPVPNSYHHL